MNKHAETTGGKRPSLNRGLGRLVGANADSPRRTEERMELREREYFLNITLTSPI